MIGVNENINPFHTSCLLVGFVPYKKGKNGEK